jgi:hypothetical protein
LNASEISREAPPPTSAPLATVLFHLLLHGPQDNNLGESFSVFLLLHTACYNVNVNM